MWPFKTIVDMPQPQKKRKASPNRTRRYASAVIDRLTATFGAGSALSANRLLESDLATMRQRSRQLAMDNDYARKFLNMVKANVVGSSGIRLQSLAMNEQGQPDTFDRNTIEAAWRDWSKPVNCSASERLSFLDIQRLVIETVARDGECLIRKVNGGKYGIRLHVMESDYIDSNLNDEQRNIVMGIELDKWGKPLNYMMRTRHPGDNTYIIAGKSYVKIPASEIIHLYIVERPEQARGVPWMQTAIRRLDQLGAYEEAELVAARISASKMGFYKTPSGDEYTGTDTDTDGAIITDAEPGVFEQLPADWEFQAFDPQHPTSAFKDFVKTSLRGISSGLNVAYNSLSNDLEGVNFSSIRSGVLEEREQWRVLQSWFIEHFISPIYEEWLGRAILSGALQLPARKTEKFLNVRWQPRGWAWVDPLKDANANREQVALGTMTRADVAASQGKDLEEIFLQLQREKEMAEQMGIDIGNAIMPTEVVDDDTEED